MSFDWTVITLSVFQDGGEISDVAWDLQIHVSLEAHFPKPLDTIDPFLSIHFDLSKQQKHRCEQNR